MAEQQRASVSSAAAGSWLGLRLQLMAAALAAAVAGAAVAEHAGSLPWAAAPDGALPFGAAGGDSSSSSSGRSGMAAGLVGLSLSYVLPITGLLSGLLTSSAETGGWDAWAAACPACLFTNRRCLPVYHASRRPAAQLNLCPVADNPLLQSRRWWQLSECFNTWSWAAVVVTLVGAAAKTAATAPVAAEARAPIDLAAVRLAGEQQQAVTWKRNGTRCWRPPLLACVRKHAGSAVAAMAAGCTAAT